MLFSGEHYFFCSQNSLVACSSLSKTEASWAFLLPQNWYFDELILASIGMIDSSKEIAKGLVLTQHSNDMCWYSYVIRMFVGKKLIIKNNVCGETESMARTKHRNSAGWTMIHYLLRMSFNVCRYCLLIMEETNESCNLNKVPVDMS